MAELSGTLDTYGVKGAREDLQNAIFMITPEDTPFISNIGRSRAKATKHEWQTDTLANPDTTNAQLEGDEYAYSTPAATVRVGNFTQISRKPVLVSRTLEAVDKAGRASELKYQSMKRGKELRKDMEAIVLSNRAFTEAMLKTAQQAAYTAGGNPRIAMVPAAQKVAFSGFTGIAQIRKDITGARQATIIGGADVYVGDFGTITTVVNRVMDTHTAFLVDPKMVSLTTLRPMTLDKPAQTGDAIKRMMIVEYSLEVNNEAAHAVIADLT
jgi:hypothetical protein